MEVVKRKREKGRGSIKGKIERGSFKRKEKGKRKGDLLKEKERKERGSIKREREKGKGVY